MFQYVKLRGPFVLNDVEIETGLWDRQFRLHLLEGLGAPMPLRLHVDRDRRRLISTFRGLPQIPECIARLEAVKRLEAVTLNWHQKPQKVELLDGGETLGFNGQRLEKPFVERSMNNEEDEIVIIYYPKRQGGGALKLFNLESGPKWVRDATSEIPRAIIEPYSSYIYEPTVAGSAVKVYVIGYEYCYAEICSWPVVNKTDITTLSSEEYDMAHHIATRLGQRVCGFTFVRQGGKSIVIDVDVEGWMLVADNPDYYDRCAAELRKIFKHEIRRQEEGLGDNDILS